jgi:cAMP-dependent protein kinase regulator
MAAVMKRQPKTTDQLVRIECAIQDNILFKDLDQMQKNQLYEAMFEKEVGPGKMEEICKQGDEGDHYYIIDSGAVDFIVGGRVVGSASDGDSFGELALMYFAPRAATCKATKPTTLWCMDRNTFRSYVLASGSEKRDKQKEFLKSVELLKVHHPCIATPKPRHPFFATVCVFMGGPVVEWVRATISRY